MPACITPLELSVLAWPASIRPSELGPPRIGVVQATKAGPGGLLITGAPYDAHTVRVEIVAGGQPGVATYRYRTDGLTWSDTLPTSTEERELLSTAPDELTEGADTGLRVAFVGGTPAPSFVALDRWDVVTKPVQAVVAAIVWASNDALRVVGARYQGLLTTPDAAVKGDIADLARLRLAERRGMDPASTDGKLYIGSADRARVRLVAAASKTEHPRLGGEGPIYAPDMYEGGDRGGIAAAHRRRGGARE